jgi:hypothetical protein
MRFGIVQKAFKDLFKGIFAFAGLHGVIEGVQIIHKLAMLVVDLGDPGSMRDSRG